LKKSLDIILPCFNPLDGWHKTVLKSYKLLSEKLSDTSIKVILIDDGSTINIQNEISFLQNEITNFSFIKLKQNFGKGYAIREGFKISTSENMIFTDIDFPYKESNLIEMFFKLQKGADFVIGIRQESYYKKVPFLRKYLSLSFKKLLKIIFRIPSTDTQAGLKAFSIKIKHIVLKTTVNRYLFDLELVKLASKDKNINFEYSKLELKDDIILSQMSFGILFKEFKNLIKILFL